MNPYDTSTRQTNPYRFYKPEQELEAARILREAPPLELETDKGTEHVFDRRK